MSNGIGAAPGIAIGRAYVLPVWEWELPEKPGKETDLASEMDKLYSSIRFSREELEEIKSEIRELIGEEESHIFNAHLAILDDPVFLNEVQDIMKRQFKAAEVAVKEAIDKFVGMFDLLEDEYMKERAGDIRDVGNRLLKHLLGDFQDVETPVEHPCISVGKELSPSQFANLNLEKTLGVVTMLGGTTSHAAIMARAIGIPCVLGMEGKLNKPIQTGDLLIIDGSTGTVLVNPEIEEVEEYQNRKALQTEEKEILRKIVTIPPVTADGKRLEIRANINSVKELTNALEYGVAGVGLFRTEFLFMERSIMPTEEEQFHIYQEALGLLNGEPLTIRAMDIGGDKPVNYIALPQEANPSMGLRAIRILLKRTDLFRTQLRAILRAGAYGKVKILLPMVSSIDDIWKSKEIIADVERELAEEGITFGRNIPVGIMIELPAAAGVADLMAQEVDFMSIGTNDLIQYVLGVDRMNEAVAELYEPFHPAVLRLLNHVARAGCKAGIPVSICGEMAGDPLALPLWIGFGIHEVSMSVQSVLPFKSRLLATNAERCKEIAEQVLTCRTSGEVRKLLTAALPTTLPAPLTGDSKGEIANGA
ncbi:phosphoenolpyruvate--protein phosphotransferase [Gorillibacterium massiliense]|uniref:phosphoenolpyruvate--protein phosphotransferase n=1 Tax=Gorillibacterium massiliense TaxID=1280390 RepID=UPI0004B229D2|nr:phosphoenolpyruvate--protein phosphotransferase [Gorillibacterium massiliense]